MWDLQQGDFAYSQRSGAAEHFLPRHTSLETLEAISKTSQEVVVPMRQYTAQLLHGWMQYLQEGEGIFINTYTSRGNWDGSEPASNGKRSIDMFPIIGLRKVLYNYVNDPSEPETKQLKHRDFAQMSVAERQRLFEQHPEIAMQFDAYDAVTRGGVFPQGFVYVMEHAYQQVKGTPKTPEEYTGDLRMDMLAKIVDKLFDDTEIYNLRTGERIGEVCFRCQRIDP